MTVTVKGTIFATSPGMAARIRAALPAHITLSRAEPGNIHFNITQTDDPLVWQVDEAFESPAAFEAHKARMAQADWASAAEGLGRDLTITGME